MRPRAHLLWWILLSVGLGSLAGPALAEDVPEYRLKAAFLYNFVLFTEWPATIGPTLLVCVVGRDPFGPEIDALQGKPVGARSVTVQRRAAGEALQDCHAVFIASSAMPALPRLLDRLRGQPVLTVADTPGAAAQGVALNMALSRSGGVTFEANAGAARASGLALSSKLLRVATEVHR